MSVKEHGARRPNESLTHVNVVTGSLAETQSEVDLVGDGSLDERVPLR
jgi:hypothetical protein